MQLLYVLLEVTAVLMLLGTSCSIGISTISKRVLSSTIMSCSSFGQQPYRRYSCSETTIIGQRIHPRRKGARRHTVALCSSTQSVAVGYDQHYQGQQKIKQRRTISLIPEPFNTLKIGEAFCPIPDLAPGLTVKRLAKIPDIFLVRQLLPLESERKSLVDETSRCQMSLAESTFGPTSKRRGSNVWWINDEAPSSSQHSSYHCQATSFSPPGRQVAHYMSNISAHLFLPRIATTTGTTKQKFSVAEQIQKERLQLVQYEPGGAFDLHHDGQSRFLTVLTYVNGVAGTWFPFAQTCAAPSMTSSSDEDDCIKVEDKLILKNGETPGRNGLLIVGSEHNSIIEAPTSQRNPEMVTLGGRNRNLCLSEEESKMTFRRYTASNDNNSAVVHIQPGDAVVFYNYNFCLGEKKEGVLNPVPNWRAIHAALPTRKEKWIATNWFSYHSEVK